MAQGLAIETSGRVGSVALVDAGTVVAEQQFAHGLQNAARILPIIDDLCRSAGWGPKDLGELYVSIGPGSFTGLRIGVTLVKTLAFVTHARVFAVPTVRVLAHNAPQGWHHAIIVLDAKRDQIYTARFRNDGGDIVEEEPAHLASLREVLARSPRPVHLIGEGIPYHRQHVPNEAGVIVTDPQTWQARASVVARIGVEMSRSGTPTTDPLHLVPIYIRLPEAEEKWRASQASG